MNASSSKPASLWLLPIALVVVAFLCYALTFTLTTCGIAQLYVVFTTLPTLVIAKWPIEIMIAVLGLIAGTKNPILEWLGGQRVQKIAIAVVILGAIALGYGSGDPSFVGKCV